jgi:predicted ferric reductase
MDKAYIWHKWLGIFGLVGASFHWLLVPGPAGNGIDPQFADMGEEMGQWAMYALLLLGSVSMVKQIPYRIWFYTHKLMGPIFAISVYHTFFSDVPFEVASVTGGALILVSAIGIGAWLYKSLFSSRGHRKYIVTEIEKLDDAIEVTLMPQSKAITYNAGQFAYLDFGFDKVEHFHPFTIASSPQSDSLSFIIRGLGRHTKHLQDHVTVNQVVTVDGGYGRLHTKRNTKQPQIWIAGGIGITPFIAWLRDGTEQSVDLFYVGRGKLYIAMLNKLAGLVSGNNIRLHSDASQQSRLTHEVILSELDKPIEKYQVFACGPQGMLEELKSGLVAAGLPRRRWKNENFQMR